MTSCSRPATPFGMTLRALTRIAHSKKEKSMFTKQFPVFALRIWILTTLIQLLKSPFHSASRNNSTRLFPTEQFLPAPRSCCGSRCLARLNLLELESHRKTFPTYIEQRQYLLDTLSVTAQCTEGEDGSKNLE